VLNISLATNERYKNAQGEWVERTEWHRVKVWGKRAEGLSKILAKGDQLYLEGRISTSKYEKDGVMRYSTEIMAIEVIPLKYTGLASDERGNSEPRQVAQPPEAPKPAQHRQTSFRGKPLAKTSGEFPGDKGL
jgi:single-strand DNA-binding protein